MSTKDKLIKTGIVLFLILLAAFFTYFAYLQILVARGDLIKDHGQWYKKADWDKLFGEYDTPAKNTPEEVYKNFRQALLDNDIETALELIRMESRENYRTAFQDKEKFKNWVNSLPEEITEESTMGNFANYNVNMGTEYKNTAMFRKNQEGYWEIDSI